MNLYFTRESRDYPDVFSVTIGLRTGPNWICEESIQLQKEKSKISRRGSRCPEYAELGHFTLLGSLSNDDGDAEDNALWKINLYFTRESRDYPDVFSVSIGLRTGSSWICKESIELQIEKTKISRCGSRCPEYVELGHFTLLFCRERLGNVPRLQTHVQSYCSAH